MLQDLKPKIFVPDKRCNIDRLVRELDLFVFCRNAYANYYQYIGQRIFLEDLQKNGSSENVVFMDMDVLVLDSILEIFCQDYGYAVTINANSYDPVDIGVQFVHRNHYSDGIAFLQVRFLDSNFVVDPLLVIHPEHFEFCALKRLSFHWWQRKIWEISSFLFEAPCCSVNVSKEDPTRGISPVS